MSPRPRYNAYDIEFSGPFSSYKVCESRMLLNAKRESEIHVCRILSLILSAKIIN